MKPSPIVVKHQKKLADSLSKFVKDKRAKHPVREAPTTFTISTHTSHKLAAIKSKKNRDNKNNG